MTGQAAATVTDEGCVSAEAAVTGGMLAYRKVQRLGKERSNGASGNTNTREQSEASMGTWLALGKKQGRNEVC